MFQLISDQEQESIKGGSTVNFNISAFSFGTGAGIVFNGAGDYQNTAFQLALYTSPVSSVPTPVPQPPKPPETIKLR